MQYRFQRSSARLIACSVLCATALLAGCGGGSDTADITPLGGFDPAGDEDNDGISNDIDVDQTNGADANLDGIDDSFQDFATLDSDFDGINDNVDVDVTGGTDADGNGIDDMFDGGDTTPLACNGTSGSDEDSFTADWSDNCFVSQSNANRQSEYTRGIQRILNCLGYPQDDPAAELADDADFGENTALAVSAFQTDSNLSSVDGVVGPETWGALEDVLVPVPALSDDSATAYTVGFWDPDGDGFDNTQCPAPVDVLFYENLNPTDGQPIWEQADEPGSTARRPFKIGFD